MSSGLNNIEGRKNLFKLIG